MAERRRRPRHRPRLAPPRAVSAPPPAGPAAAFTAFRRELRAPLDRIAARVERPRPIIADRATMLWAAAWRAPFWLWLIMAFATGLPMAAPTPFAIAGMTTAAAAAFADIAGLRRLSVAGLRAPSGEPAPAEFRWVGSAALLAHGILALVASLVSAAPALIGLLGGYAW